MLSQISRIRENLDFFFPPVLPRKTSAVRIQQNWWYCSGYSTEPVILQWVFNAVGFQQNQWYCRRFSTEPVISQWVFNRSGDIAVGIQQNRWYCSGYLTEVPCWLFVLSFYGPVNPMGSCRAQSVYLTT